MSGGGFSRPDDDDLRVDGEYAQWLERNRPNWAELEPETDEDPFDLNQWLAEVLENTSSAAD